MNATRALAALTLMSLLPASARPATTDDVMTKARLEADLGHYDKASTLLTSVADDVTAAPALRWQALARLGSVRRAAGDRAGAVRAYQTVMDRFGTEPDAVKAVVGAITGITVPTQRWERIWKDVRVVANGDPRMLPASIAWPGVDGQECRPPEFPGVVVSLDFKEATLSDVFRFLSDFSGTAINGDPCLNGLSIDARVAELPWDAALRDIVGAFGLSCRRSGDAIAVSCSANTPAPPAALAGKGACFHLRFAEKPLVPGGPVPDCAGPLPCQGIRETITVAGDLNAERLLFPLGRVLEKAPDLAGETVHICGDADTLGQVTMVLGGMQESPIWKDVDLKATTITPEQRFHFHITATYAPAAR